MMQHFDTSALILHVITVVLCESLQQKHLGVVRSHDGKIEKEYSHEKDTLLVTLTVL